MKNKNLLNWLWTDSHEKQLPQRFVRYAAILIMLLTLVTGQMWADDTFSINGGYVYFDNTTTNWSNYFQFIGRQKSWAGYIDMSQVSNTKLYVCDVSGLNGWNGFYGFAVVRNTSKKSNGNTENSNSNNYTAYQGNYTLNSGSYYLISPSSSGNNCSITTSYVGSAATSLNRTITVKAKTSTNNGSSYSDAASGFVTLTASSKKFSSYNTCTTTTSLSSGAITCGYTATTTLTAPTTDPSGYKFDGWYNSSGTRQTTSKTLTIYPTGDATYYAYYRKLYTISASSTVVWDLCENEKSWSAVYLYKDIEGGSTSNDAFTQCGSTTQYRKNYASAVSNVKVWLFRAQNGSTWSDYKQTTDIYLNASGVTLFEFDNTYDGKKLNWQVTTGAKKATSGTKVYFDNTATNWGEVWLKYGTTRFNRHTGAAATKVTGTANLYVITMPEAYYVKWYFADKYGYTNRNSIETMTGITNRINYQTSDLTSDITYIPSTGSGTPKVWTTTTLSGHTRRLTFGSHTNGNITVRYTDESGVEQTVSSASADHVDVAQTCQVIITAVPNSGYAPSTLTLGGVGITSGAQQIIRAAGTIEATFVAEETHDVTVSYKYGTRSLRDAQTFEVGVTTASDISAEVIDGFTFSSWSNLTNVTNNSANLTTNPININTIVSGSDGSMTCNYTPWTCSLDIVPSEGATGHSSRTAMSYDATEKAYYINRTTASSTERYRFYIDSKEYSTSGNTELVIAGTKVDANTPVQGYGSNKPSVYFNDGGTGSNITVWFDYENKKAWVTEQKHTVTISSGGNGTVSPTSVSVGNVVASGTITATADEHYHWSSWDVPSGVTVVSGSGTKTITIKATAADKTVTANFAGDLYTITYKDQGDVAYTGNNEASLPKTHTYGTATALVNGAKTGYTFGGWYTDASCTSAAGSSIGATTKTANFTLYAKWTENLTTVNLIASPTGKGTFTIGGAAATSTTAGITTTRSVTAVPAAGYRVNTSTTVWSTNNANITLNNVKANPVTVTGAGPGGTSTLTATFTPNVYTITLNANSGTGGPASATVTFDDKNFVFATSFVAPTRTGYIFQGYYTASSMGDGEQLIDKDGNWHSDTEPYVYIDGDGNWIYPDNMTLYAGWTPITYTVTYHANGGSAKSEQLDPTVTDWTYDVDDYISVSSTYFDAPSGYDTYSTDSKYWNDSPNGDGTDYAYAYVRNLTSTNGGNIDLYAQWWRRFNIEANYDEGVDGFFRVHYNTAIIEPSPSTLFPTRLGYLVEGYYTAAEGGNKVLNANGTVVSGTVTDWVTAGKWIYTGAQSTIYAHWNQIHYNLAFNGNDCSAYVGEATGSKASLAGVAYEDEVDITSGTFAREGYEFSGWSKTACATTASYIGDTWHHISYTNGDNVTLYAVWRPNTYTISFNGQGAYSVDETSRPIRMGDNYGTRDGYTSSLPTAYKSGYEFLGWYTRPNGAGTHVTDETQMTTASDHTLYAYWAKAARVYFKNTLGWESVYVTWDATWNYNSQDKGAGAKGKTQQLMSHIYGTDIWYKDIPAAILSSWKGNIAFTNMAMDDYEWFDDGQAVYRRDFDSDATMFVPTPNDPYKYTKNTHDPKPGTVYYSTDMIVDKSGDDITNYRYKNGYWVRYDELQSGYTVKGSWAWDDDHYVERHSLNDSTYVFTIRNLAANTDYWFNLYKHCTTSNSYSSVFKPAADMTSASSDVVFSAQYAGGSDKKMKTTVAGDYTFKFVFSRLGEIRLTIEYPLAVNDYRVVYSYTKGGAQTFASEYIKAKADAVDTISMFIHSADSATARSLYIQKCTGISAGVPTWNTTYSAITLPSETASGKTSGVYNFRIAQNGSAAATGESIGKYDGNYYIRTDSAAGGWDFYKEYPSSQMTFSEYSLSQTLSAPYSHYYCQYVGNSSTDISYTIATDYSPAICPIQEGDATIGVGNKTLPSGKPASIRFTWNEETNATFRSYLKSAQGDGNKRFLVLHGSDNKVLDADGNTIAGEGAGAEQMHANELLFSDTENWVYELRFKAKPGAKVSIIARYNGSDRYLVGSSTSWETIISGGADTKYDIAAVYDFKTNRLITTWVPSGTISDQIKEVDVLIERHNQNGATTITFGKAAVDAEAGSISAKRVIGALRFDYNELVGRVASWTPDTRAKMMFFVSFPFDVNVSDIFGLNSTYGEAFIVQGYNGAKRAEKGFFKGDGTDTFWETLPVDTVMHAGVGYVVTLDNDYFNGDVGHIWDNKRAGDHVYMYFPSANDPEHPVIINSDDKTINVPAHLCTINRTFNGGKLNHKYTDSNWNLMGVPIFQNHTGDDGIDGTPGAIFTATKEPEDTTSYANPENPTFGYFYEWHTDKTYTIAKADGFTFKPMHSYMVQYAGNVKFTCAEPVVPSLAPRRTAMKENYNIELQVLNNGGDMLNHTYVELRENACDTFALNEDTYMMSSNKAVSVYTFAGTYDVAANVLSIGSHVVPVGVIVKQAGTYTFTMPSNFSGTVTLVDTYAQTRTNLNIEDYEVSLPKGTDEERFYLEININKVPTAIDGAKAGEGTLKDGKVHKFIMNDQMYILKDGVLYDARGNRVK